MQSNSIKSLKQCEQNIGLQNFPQLGIKHSVSLSTNEDFSSQNISSSWQLSNPCLSSFNLGDPDNVQQDWSQKRILQKPELENKYNSLQNYKLQEVIGRGNFGVVYRSVFLPTCQQVALKVINFSQFEESYRENVIEFYENQVKILEQLKNKSKFRFTCSYFGAFVHEDCGYISMELLEGFSLQQLIQSEFHLSSEEERFYLASIILAVQELHESIGCIHRDIKPQNIMILPNGELLLLDFGCAKLLNKNQRTSSITGTCEYFSPSRFRCSYGMEADVWSFAVTAYQLITRQLPFRYKHMQNSNQQQKFNKLSSLLRKQKDIKLSQLNQLDPIMQCLIENIFNSIAKNDYKCDSLNQIKSSQYFKSMEWELLKNKKLKPPRVFSQKQIRKIKDLEQCFYKDF